MDLTAWCGVASLRDAPACRPDPAGCWTARDDNLFAASVLGVRHRFATVDSMTESEPEQSAGQPARQPAAEPEPGAQAAGDTLAARLLAAQRLLCALDLDSDVRLRLQLRYAAICTSLKLPSADRARGSERLDRLIADAEAAFGEGSGTHVYSADNAEPGAGSRDSF
jgi:hypothetical protein